MRWRMGAAVIDNLIVYAGYLGLCGLLHWRVASVQHIWLLLLAGVGYHFVLETRNGQTVGKRRYGVRVVAVDGGIASPKAVAVRSLLRIIDQLPVCYASGLVSLVRTGPTRRQRLGDVVAGTSVIAVDGHAARHGSPRWLLPVATLLAILASGAFTFGLLNAGNQPLTDSQRAGFIAGCENSAGGRVLDCRCFLERLQSAGYTTINGLRGVVADARSETVNGVPGAARTAMFDAAMACRY